MPPEKRVVNVAVEPSQKTYKPGQKAKVKLKLTDADGKPFVGSTVLTVYDKAVEYISGGSNVPEIKEFFWKWRRSHHPQTESSLDRWFAQPAEAERDRHGRPGRLRRRTSTTSRWRRADVGDQMAPRPDGGMMGGMGGGMAMAADGADGRASAAAAMAGVGEGRRRRRDEVKTTRSRSADGFDGASHRPSSPTVRTNFADTAFWAAALTTGAGRHRRGRVHAAREPDDLEGQGLGAWATAPRSARARPRSSPRRTCSSACRRRGSSSRRTRSSSRPTSTTISRRRRRSRSSLELDGGVLEPLGRRRRRPSTIAAGGEQRVDWRVKVAHEGEAVVRMKALTDEESDAMQMTLPGLRPRHAQDGVVRRRRSGPTRTTAQVVVQRPRRAHAPSSRGSKSATRRRWPARWSMPCRTWSTIPTAAPSRRSTASCRRSSRRRS